MSNKCIRWLCGKDWIPVSSAGMALFTTFIFA
ncbi:hypothetical protein GO684_02140 [Wolbachia endosymbiont of Litomosoides brasiliensis]|nr:hypothetical protein [Wolbachia endosymbiont of Litomosoides brasiliensis]